MRRIAICMATAVLLFTQTTAPAAGQGAATSTLIRIANDATLRAQAVKNGERTATFCANCHGQSGVSAIPDVPNLAAQNPEYLLAQIDAFVTGKRKNEFMEGMMGALTDKERAELVLYYASRPTPPGISEDGALVASGRKAFTRLCVRCHGARAHGSETRPRLAGQQPEYLRLSLKRYLTMSGERFYPPMTAEVMKLGENRIDAVVHYLRTLK